VTRVAVLANELGFLQETLDCLRIAGIDALVFEPATSKAEAVQLLNGCSHIIVKGHCSDHRLMARLRATFDGKIIAHWFGSDAYNTLTSLKRRVLVALAQRFVDENWVVGVRLLSPLRKLGIKAEVVPHLIHRAGRTPPMPRARTRGVLVYANKTCGRLGLTASELYGLDLAIRLSHELPSFTFHFVGGGEVPSGGGSNVIHHGWFDDLSPVWEASDYYFRVTKSDGLPGMVVESAENLVLPVVDYPYFDGVILFEGVPKTAEVMRSYSQFDMQLATFVDHVRREHSPDVIRRRYGELLRPQTS
jgi:hypothetical protein